MAGQTIILRGPSQRHLAQRMVWSAPVDAIVNIREAKRTTEQNAKLWAMLSDVSRAKPDGREHTTDVWKALFMHACGHAVQFETGLEGQPFPLGFRSSRLSVGQMSDIIEFIYAWGEGKGVTWSEPMPEDAA